MSEAFSSLRALVSGDTKVDVPVPACLNHCINQEVFNCKICGEVFDNIHKYITHGKGHRGSSTVCGFCGGVWTSYSALCIHQLVWENKKTSDPITGGKKVVCPLACGLDSATLPEIKSHLMSFHGAEPDRISSVEEDGNVRLKVELIEPATCPKCETKLSKAQVRLDTHIAFQCLKRSGPVQQRVAEIENQGYQAGEDPILLLLQEIQALILHLKGLLEKGEYREKYLEESIQADKKYPKLPPSFSKEFLTWVPVGYTLQVLISEEENFLVMFDIWSQVVDKLSGPDNLQDVTLKLEKELSQNVNSGFLPRWGSLMFDPAMLDPPEQDVLSRLERELGWVK
ncbi:uncharacterized protein LOC111706274 [Eurytemora carolleeae]|uniref:uncharacterized protein LOC111706274 n=1 Tax=Eurytemora carolleeae TaxID=1294199 RepID=UPI000C78AD44|nr:uncharacterized protein LOC111706274 [Eurytemora carolleeae]XP_023334876.1 uncharacterized protein LOC111706274 [Eurytemora carolleeae]|eukprot:XP_023334875.1 uncharacterized protein LOC111706274 [Eurytemora affinis]